MEQENFSPEESLKLIQNMITKTRQDMGDKSKHFLLWGWITLIACVGQFVLKNIFDYEKHYLVWLLIIPGVIISTYFGVTDQRKQKVNTYIGDSMKYLWMGMGISFFVLGTILGQMGWNNNVFPFFMLLYGLGTFIWGNFSSSNHSFTGDWRPGQWRSLPFISIMTTRYFLQQLPYW